MLLLRQHLVGFSIIMSRTTIQNCSTKINQKRFSNLFWKSVPVFQQCILEVIGTSKYVRHMLLEIFWSYFLKLHSDIHIIKKWIYIILCSFYARIFCSILCSMNHLSHCRVVCSEHLRSEGEALIKEGFIPIWRGPYTKMTPEGPAFNK